MTTLDLEAIATRPAQELTYRVEVGKAVAYGILLTEAERDQLLVWARWGKQIEDMVKQELARAFADELDPFSPDRHERMGRIESDISGLVRALAQER